MLRSFCRDDSMRGRSPAPEAPAREAGTFVAKSRALECSGKEKRGAARRAALEQPPRMTKTMRP